MLRLDASAIQSIAESQPPKQYLHRLQARIELIFKNKSEGSKMSAAAIKKSVIGALGGAMHGIEDVLLARNRYGDIDLCGNAYTIVWVSDFGPETDIESQFGERLLASLSTGAKFPAVGDCFSSIRVKSGQPSMVRVVPSEENPLPTVLEVERSIESHLFKILRI